MFHVHILSQTRAGSHENVVPPPVEPSAFSFCRRTGRTNPREFTRKGSGGGGHISSLKKSTVVDPNINSRYDLSKFDGIKSLPAISPTKSGNMFGTRASTAGPLGGRNRKSRSSREKLQHFPAFSSRPNPPNSDIPARSDLNFFQGIPLRMDCTCS